MDLYNIVFNMDNEGNKLSAKKEAHPEESQAKKAGGSFRTLKDGTVVFIEDPGGKAVGKDTAVVPGGKAND